MKKRALLTLAILYAVQSVTLTPDLPFTLKCHRRLYNHTVTKKDFYGKACRDAIEVMSCWGRCDSNEISDWRFPYRMSHHPVCMHDMMERVRTILKDCDSGTLPGTDIYEYERAVSCKCRDCVTSEASCEGLRYRETRFRPELLS